MIKPANSDELTTAEQYKIGDVWNRTFLVLIIVGLAVGFTVKNTTNIEQGLTALIGVFLLLAWWLLSYPYYYIAVKRMSSRKHA